METALCFYDSDGEIKFKLIGNFADIKELLKEFVTETPKFDVATPVISGQPPPPLEKPRSRSPSITSELSLDRKQSKRSQFYGLSLNASGKWIAVVYQKDCPREALYNPKTGYKYFDTELEAALALQQAYAKLRISKPKLDRQIQKYLSEDVLSS